MAALWPCLGLIMLFIVSLPSPALFGEDKIDVKRDQDKTVYTIGQDDQNRREEEKERDRAWEMLKNMWIRNQKKGQPPKDQPTQPTQNK